METKLKETVVGKSFSGLMKNIGAMYHKIIRVPVETTEIDAVSAAGYESSTERQAQSIRFEVDRSQAQAEARKNLMTC